MRRKNAPDIGAYIKAERLQRGWTQEMLAGQCGVSLSQMQSIEANRRRPSFETLYAMVCGMDMSFDRFARGTGPQDSPEREMLICRVRSLPNADVALLHDVLNALKRRDGDAVLPPQ